MKKKYLQNSILFSFFLFFSFSFNVRGQEFTSSNLPIIVINTSIDSVSHFPFEIVDEPRVMANMKIIKHPDGSRNFMADSSNEKLLDYNGKVSIETRGSTSQDLPKKSYSFSTLIAQNNKNNNVSLLGMADEHDWILNAISYDPSLIRDYLSYNLSRKMGNYTTQTAYCEVVLNGDYKGLYILQEKIKVDDHRVNILKLSNPDVSLPTISGGYIVKIDKVKKSEKNAWILDGANFVYCAPRPSDINKPQNEYIQKEFDKLNKTTIAGNASLLDGYPTVIDVPSFIDYMLLNELGSNADAYQFSTFFHKERNGKLIAGPIWDMNLTYGNDLFMYGADRSKDNVWQFSNGSNEGPEFWKNLFKNDKFKAYMSKRWHELTLPRKPMHPEVLNAFIDETAALISEAAIREHKRWVTVPNLKEEIKKIKTFIKDRNAWITNNIGQPYPKTAIVIPNLVISKINYHPVDSDEFPNGDVLEFIEITNNSDKKVNLSGIYFRDLGFTYQFPYKASLGAKKSLILASNAKAFERNYGFAPFGEYTRNLSNKSERITMIDAFGTIIDSVEYSDSKPWPIGADGEGSYLKLKNISSDNSLPENWKSTKEKLFKNN